jgi:hypothetical protein
MIRDQARALERRHIQHNTPWALKYLIFDVDDLAPFDAIDQAGVLPPTAVVVGPSGRGHLIYELATPVITGENARSGPIRYLAAIRQAYTVALGADVAYTGLITKNPCHPDHQLYITGDRYELADLAAEVTLPYPPFDQPSTEPELELEGIKALSRNCFLFRVALAQARQLISAGALIDLSGEIDSYLVGQNNDHFVNDPRGPLPHSHIKSITKSIYRYASRWSVKTPRPNEGILRPILPRPTDLAGVRENQAAGAAYTNARRKAGTLKRLVGSLKRLRNASSPSTIAAIIGVSGLSRATLYRLLAASVRRPGLAKLFRSLGVSHGHTDKSVLRPGQNIDALWWGRKWPEWIVAVVLRYRIGSDPPGYRLL